MTPPRWRGERGRTEVWYATLTDASTGTGVWVHCETVAPTGDAAPYGHGWIAVFEQGEAAPVVERFGPAPVEPRADATWFDAGGAVVRDGELQGSAGSLSWDLRFGDDSPALYTFPKAVWDRQLLPGCQIVPWPTARFDGTVSLPGGRTLPIERDRAEGAVARIYGHGNAQRWGWLHAPVEGGGVLEIVTATARRRALRRVRPLAMVQLRLPGEPDWPANPALASVRFRTNLRPDGFRVSGRVGRRRLDVEVDVPAGRSVSLLYTDPDGATARCTNSELASATIRLSESGATRTWDLDGTAHAEVGTRPA